MEGGAELELADQRQERIGLVGEFAAGGGGFLDHGGVLLGHLVHLVDGAVDFGERPRLVLRRRRDGFDMLADRGDLLAEGGWNLPEDKELTIKVGELTFLVPNTGAYLVRVWAERVGNSGSAIAYKESGEIGRGIVANNEYVFAVREREDQPPLQSFLSLPPTTLAWEATAKDGDTVVTVRNTGGTAALWVRLVGIPTEQERGPVVRPLEDGFVLLPSETAERIFSGTGPEDYRWQAKALNTL